MKSGTRQSRSEFQKLWDVLPHPPGSVIRVFARLGDHRRGDFATSPKEIERFAKTYRDHNVYVAPNPTSRTAGMRHAAKDVTHWSYFLIDIDPVCTCPPDRVKKKLLRLRCLTCRGMADPRAAMDEALLWFGEWVGRDFREGKSGIPIIIDSGRGVQAWIRINDVVLDDRVGDFEKRLVDRVTARRVNGYWLKKLDERLGVIHGCRIDTSVSDLPRVMRCPGTVNVKTGRVTKFIHSTDYVFSGLAELMYVKPPPEAMKDPEVPVGIKPGQRWQMVFHHLTRMAQNYLTYGQAEPGRHKCMWHTSKKLHELGVTREEARRALSWANLLKGKKEALPSDQIEHALDTAYASG